MLHNFNEQKEHTLHDGSKRHLLSCMRLLFSHCVDNLPLRVQGNAGQLLDVGRVRGAKHHILPAALCGQEAQNLLNLLPAGATFLDVIACLLRSMHGMTAGASSSCICPAPHMHF